MLTKIFRRVSYPVMGYLFLLLAFALLGLFVAALACRSGYAAVAGVALAGALFAAVEGFRKGAMKLAQTRADGELDYNVSIWSKPLRREQIDRYYVNYRGGPRRPHMAVARVESRPDQRKRPLAAVPSRLSA